MSKNNNFTRIVGLLLCGVMVISCALAHKVISKADELEYTEKTGSVLVGNDVVWQEDISFQNIATGQEDIKIAIMNDFHYFSKELYSDCEDYRYNSSSEKKLFLESDSILSKFIEEIKLQKPDVVLIGGDLSKDGEVVNHEQVASKLKAMKEDLHNSGVDTQIYVTNGNHDINSSGAVDYSSGKAEPIYSVNSTEFKQIYQEFGYGQDSEFYTTTMEVGGCLSYATDIGKGYTLIVVDSNKYTPDQTKTGTAVAETGGMVSDELLRWVQQKAKEAYEKGNVPILMQHHSITKHFSAQNMLGKDFIIDDYKKVANAYADAGINIVFSGHSHASDVAMADIENENKVYDIMTSSLVGYPISTRTVYIGANNGKLTLDSEVHFYDEIDYIDESTGEKIADIQAYAYDKCMGLDATERLMSKDTVEFALDTFKKRNGIKGLVARTLGVDIDHVTDEIIKLIKEKLPSREDDGIEVSISKFKFKVFYDDSKDALYIKQKTKKITSKLAVELYVPVDELRLFIEDMYVNIDKNILNNPEEVNEVFQKIVGAAFEYKIGGKYTMYEYYITGYDYYKCGFNCTDEKLEEYVGGFKKDTKMSKGLIKNVVWKSCKKELKKLLALNKLDLSKLIKSGNDNITSKLIVKVLNSSFDDLGDVWIKVGKRIILSDKFVTYINDIIIGIQEGLMRDVNISDDNTCRLEIDILNQL